MGSRVGRGENAQETSLLCAFVVGEEAKGSICLYTLQGFLVISLAPFP